jgi:hypothetical protein
MSTTTQKIKWHKANEPQFELLTTSLELFDTEEGTASLYEQHYFVDGVKIINYTTIDEHGNERYWESTKDPEELTRDERYRVLDYTLSAFDDDEIVNYYDLFLQGEFIKEVTKFKQ